MRQPELSKKLYQLIKTENHAIGAYEQAGKETQSIASQLSEWGESTEDDAVSDISDKLGVLLAEIAEQEDLFAQNMEESRTVLKGIRNTEASVQPTRNNKQKVRLGNEYWGAVSYTDFENRSKMRSRSSSTRSLNQRSSSRSNRSSSVRKHRALSQTLS